MIKIINYCTFKLKYSHVTLGNTLLEIKLDLTNYFIVYFVT